MNSLFSRHFYFIRDSILTVIDILNKFIVFSIPIEATASILIEFGTCFLITNNKTAHHLDEKDLQSKLNLLFKKNLYDIAVRIAKSSHHDKEGLADIFRQYGDHLYSKGDFAGAVEQYIKTIEFLEPSYVIRRFLDSRHINHLTEYLLVAFFFIIIFTEIIILLMSIIYNFRPCINRVRRELITPHCF